MKPSLSHSIPLFYCPEAREAWGERAMGEQTTAPLPRVPLSPEESHHALRVLRMETGEAIRLFDGAGCFYEATLAEASRREAVAEIRAATPSLAEPHSRVILLVALLKGQKADLIVQKCTELGVSEIVFFPARRSVERIRAEAAAREAARWERIVVAACKQCGRAGLMTVSLRPSLEDALAALPEGGPRVVFWEHAAPEAAEEAPVCTPHQPVVALIGPEGGFAAEEVERVRAAGFAPRSLGPRILRAETAVLAAATLMLAGHGDLGPCPS